MDKRKILNNNIKKNLRKFAKYLDESGFELVKMIIFGSFARGEFKKYSDIDVCVVIKNLNKNLDEEMARLISLGRLADSRIEPIPYTLKELKNSDDPLAYEIRKHGIEIWKR